MPLSPDRADRPGRGGQRAPREFCAIAQQPPGAPPGEGLRAPAPAHCAALALTLRRVALRARYLGIGTASVSSWRLATGDSECDWVAAVGEGDGAEPLTFGHLGEDVFLDVLVGFTAKTGSPVRQTLR